MQAPPLLKFGFKIRTRIGLVVDNLTIPGRDAEEAERKLRQIYRDCEIINRTCLYGGVRNAPTDYEDIISLISR